MNHPSNFIDLTGKEYDNFTVIKQGDGRITKGGQYKTTWICKCAHCGNEFEIDSQSIRRTNVKSCGCKRYDFVSESKRLKLEGKKYGRLKVIKWIPLSERKNKKKAWLCLCDCGNYIEVETGKLQTGHTQSCGCLKQEAKNKIGELNKKYEHYGDKKLYGVYKAMIDRCYNSQNSRYSSYGERGIIICDEWLGDNGYDNFAKWTLLTRKDDSLTIDRINVNGNYEPSNCRWITNQEQQYNKRTNVMVEYNGEIHPLKFWSKQLNIPYTTLHMWFSKKNMSIQEIIDKHQNMKAGK